MTDASNAPGDRSAGSDAPRPVPGPPVPAPSVPAPPVTPSADSTGDAHVDRALAGLPAVPQAAAAAPEDSHEPDASDGIDLDAAIEQVTQVHAGLQQRLSGLSG